MLNSNDIIMLYCLLQLRELRNLQQQVSKLPVANKCVSCQLRWILQWPLWSDQTGHSKICRSPKKFLAKMARLFWPVKYNSVRIFAGKFSQTIMTAVNSRSFCGGQNGLTMLAKIFFGKVWIFVATMVNGSSLLMYTEPVSKYE